MKIVFKLRICHQHSLRTEDICVARTSDGHSEFSKFFLERVNRQGCSALQTNYTIYVSKEFELATLPF